MAKNTNTTNVVQGEASVASAPAEYTVRVRIMERCTAAGCVLAPGARISLPKSKAEALVALKKAVILGV